LFIVGYHDQIFTSTRSGTPENYTHLSLRTDGKILKPVIVNPGWIVIHWCNPGAFPVFVTSNAAADTCELVNGLSKNYPELKIHLTITEISIQAYRILPDWVRFTTGWPN